MKLPSLARPAARRVSRSVSRLAVAAAASLLLAAAALPVSAQTSTTAVPGLISYQGRVTNAAGTVVGSGTPVNRKVIFRIWSHASNSTINDLLYSEEQTVTISEGEFSVLIGQGAAVTGTPLGYSEATKAPSSTPITSAAVFGGAVRYLGVTIDDGTGAADPEVSPRQQLVSSAYAMRARYAESVGANGVNTITALDNGNVGVGTANPGAKLDVVGTVRAGGAANPALVLTNATNAAVGTVAAATNSGAFSTDAVANDLVMRADGGGKLLLQTGAGGSAISISTANNVGIGTASPTAKLDVNGVLNVFDGGSKFNSGGLASEAGASMVNFGINDFRFGAQSNTAQGGFLRVNTQGSVSNLFQFFARPTNGTSVSEVVSISAAGNVGIGNGAPAAKLHVNGGIIATSLSLSGAFQVPGAATTHSQGAWLEWNKDGATGVTYLLNQRGTGSGGIVLGEVSSANAITENMRITADGKVGIGTSTPAARLDVNGAIMLNPGFSNNATRPAVGTARVAGEIGAYSSGGATQDDGFLRLSAGGGTNAGTKSFIDLTGYSTVADMNTTLVFGTAGAERMRINSSGNVGIGTSAPASKLEVNGLIGLHDGGSKSRNAGIQTEVNGQLINFGVNDSSSNRFGGSYTSTDQGGFFRIDSRAGSLFSFHARAANATTTTEVISITSGGRLGINTGSPSAPLHVAASASVLTTLQAYMDADNVTAGPTNQSFTGAYAIVGDGRIRGSAFDVHSDRRIKTVVGQTSGAADLSALMGIEVTDYTFKDSVAHSGRREKKVIAQQVEQVFPQAVGQSVSAVPDIMRKGQASGAWITADTDLKIGERVRLMAGEADGVHEVLEVQPGRFRTAFAPAVAQVFVYGREVKDFRTVDYDAIAMLNVSATQEIKREKDAEVAALRAENAALRERLAALEGRDRDYAAKFAALEKMVLSASTAMAKPAARAGAAEQQ